MKAILFGTTILFAPLCMAMPEQKVVLAFPSVSYTKATTLPQNAESGSSALGVAAEYSLFLRNDLGVMAQAELNLGEGQKILFLGGAGGAKWYILGGENTSYRDSHLAIKTNPKFNVFALAGFGGKSFDFTKPAEAATETKKTPATPTPATGPTNTQTDSKNVLQGSVIGLMVGAGAEYPVMFDLLLGLRLEIFQSFSSPTTPDVSTTSLWLSVAFAL